METPRYEAEGRIAEVAVAAAFVLLVGVSLWPPGAVYWDAVADVVGESATLVTVGAIAFAIGAWFARTSSVALPHLIVGGVVAYAVGMGAIAVAFAPDSPAHLAWYGVLLAALVAGGVGWQLLVRVVRARRDDSASAGI